MALKIEPRSAWRARPAKSYVAADPKKWKGSVIHWFASPKGAHDHKDCPALLRSVQRGHMAPGGLGVKDGGSDIGYNLACCPHGVVYALRGVARQTGANGNRQANRAYCAIVAMIGEGDKPSGELKNALRETIEYVRGLGAGSEVIRHGSITGSACPGPELSAWVNVKAYEKKPAVRKPKPPIEPESLADAITATVGGQPFIYTSSNTSVSSPSFRIDVEAGNVKLTGQDPANPAVQNRLRRLFARFGEVAIRWKRK